MAGKRNTKQDVPVAGVNWLEQLAQEVNLPFEPGGWFTVAEICAKLGRKRNFVVRLLEDRKAEKKYFMSRCANGHLIRAAHYRL